MINSGGKNEEKKSTCISSLARRDWDWAVDFNMIQLLVTSGGSHG